MRQGLPYFRPADIGAVGRPVLLQMVGQHPVGIRIETADILVRGAAEVVHHGLPSLLLSKFVGKDDFGIGENRCGLAVIVEGIGIGLAHTCAAGIDQFHSGIHSPGKHCLVGVDGGLPALFVVVAEADKVVVGAIVQIWSGAVEQGPGRKEQGPALDGQHGSLGEPAVVCGRPADRKHRGSGVA